MNTFIARILLKNNQVVCCAFTGIAPILFLDWCTVHSNFKASRYPYVERGLKIKKNTKIAFDLLKTEVLVIDENPRLHKNYLDNVNEKLKDLKQKHDFWRDCSYFI